MKNYLCLDAASEHKENKVLLVYPKTGADAVGFNVTPPIPLLYIAAYIKDFSVAIFDQRTDDPETFLRLLDENPVCVGLTCMTGLQIKFALEFAEMAKKKGIPTVFGGIHPTLIPEQTQEDPRVDYVIAGEGEAAFRQVLIDLKNNVPIPPVTYGRPINLDDLPQSPYEHVDVDVYTKVNSLPGRLLPFQFSRGCPSRCTFCCNVALSHGKWRSQSVDIAISQLFDLIDRYDIDSVTFLDEHLTTNPKIFNAFIREINRKVIWKFQSKAKFLLRYDLDTIFENGGVNVGCGIESGSDRVLKMIKKGQSVEDCITLNRKVADSRMEVWYNYMMGFPGESLDDVKKTVQVALKMLDENPRAFNNTFYVLSPYPGTEIGDELSEFMPKTFEGWAEFNRHNLTAKWHDPEKLRLFSRITFSSKFTGRRLLRTFPDHAGLQELGEEMIYKWRRFDFYNDKEWDRLHERGWVVLKELFGENAY
ncbi:MAG: radical SAM protein [Desulfobacter sp.]